MNVNAVLRRFAEEEAIPAATVAELVRLADRAARENTHECNGDPHPDAGDPADKSSCARCWGRDLARTTARLQALADPYGLTVEYTGLRPCLRDRAGRYVEIPHGGRS